MVIRDTKNPLNYRKVYRKTMLVFSFIPIGISDFIKI